MNLMNLCTKVFLQITGPSPHRGMRVQSVDQPLLKSEGVGHSVSSLCGLYLATVRILFAIAPCPRVRSQLTWLCCPGALFGLLLRELGDSHPGALCEKCPLLSGAFF